MLSPAPAIQRSDRRTRASRARPAARSADPSADRTIAFLEDVLVGDSAWRLSEVRRLMELHTLIAIGHWHAEGLDLVPDAEPAC